MVRLQFPVIVYIPKSEQIKEKTSTTLSATDALDEIEKSVAAAKDALSAAVGPAVEAFLHTTTTTTTTTSKVQDSAKNALDEIEKSVAAAKGARSKLVGPAVEGQGDRRRANLPNSLRGRC